jgi:drug/metabolite transporter (DMT)-like permease
MMSSRLAIRRVTFEERFPPWRGIDARAHFGQMIETPEIQRRRAILMLILATLYWGISFPVIKTLTSLTRYLLPEAGSWFVTAAAIAPRFLLAALLMLVFRRRAGGFASSREMKQGLGVGFFAAAGTLFQTDGMQFTDASTSAFLTQFSAILIPVWVAISTRRNPGVLVWSCCALVLLGVAILGHFEWRTLKFGRGEWETLLCSVFFMGQIVYIGRKEFDGNRPGTVTLIMFAVQAVIFVALAAATAPQLHALAVPWTSPAWVGLTLTLTVVCTIGAFSIMTRWQPRITATEAGLIYCIEPVFASIFALFLPALLSAWAIIQYPNERATWSLVVGGGLITLANVLVQVRRSTRV